MNPSDRPGLADLVALITRLRSEQGCPWDRRQRLADLRAYLLEEAHELAAAIDSGNWDQIREELGDLLFQAAFVGRLAEEAGAFEIHEPVAEIHAKMVERHPHVFGSAEAATAEDVQRAWEQQKARKRVQGSHLDGVSPGLPALLAAYRLGQKAGGVGFDWGDPAQVLAKVHEELAEVAQAVAAGDGDASREELGDLLFAIASYSRHLGIDPEGALAAANAKFTRRFQAMERSLANDGKTLAEQSPADLDRRWQVVKSREGSAGG
jgi:MazG family protein